MKADLEFAAVLGHLHQVKLPDTLRKGLEKILKELGGLGEHFQGELEKIEKDPRYTIEGQRILKQELGSSMIEELAAYADPYKEHIGQAERKLFTGSQAKKTDLERILDYMKNAELRQLHNVQNMDELEVQAKSGDPDFIEAILSSPKQLISEDLRDKLIRQKAKAGDPEASQYLDQLNFANKTVKGVVKALESNIKASGWKDPEDTVGGELIS